MNNDYNTTILALIKITVDNNAGCVARILRSGGYTEKDKIPSVELEYELLKIHTINKKLFFFIMKNCKWNAGNNNWTNSPQLHEQIFETITNRTGIPVDKNNWWQVTIDYLQNQ